MAANPGDKKYPQDGQTWRYTIDEDFPVSEANLPKQFPWKSVKGWIAPTYKRWFPPDKKRDDTVQKRNMYRDPNHPIWQPGYSLLKWWDIKIRLIGSDEEGRQIVVITKGKGSPIYLRVGHTIEVFRNGEKIG